MPETPSVLTVLLNLGLGLFVVSGVLSVLDAVLGQFYETSIFTGLSAIVGLFCLLVSFLIYGLMALIPAIPKRWFLPMTLFIPLSNLAVIPLLIYFHPQLKWIALGVAICQLLLGLWLLSRLKSGSKLSGPLPLLTTRHLGLAKFSGWHLMGFLLVNFCVLIPAVLVYLALCASTAIDHFSDGFVRLSPAGIVMQVRKYRNDDGKEVQLVPMSHVGEATFYQALAASFPKNSVILMEGVTDHGKVLTSKSGYSRMAKAMGVAEQQVEFKPVGELVMADVDLSMFGKETLALLHKAMLIHSEGMSAETLSSLMQPAPAHLEKQLWEDLLTKRNAHLLEVLYARLPQSEVIIVPWGALHMPGISEGIVKSGFRVEETQDYVAIRFPKLWPF